MKKREMTELDRKVQKRIGQGMEFFQYLVENPSMVESVPDGATIAFDEEHAALSRINNAGAKIVMVKKMYQLTAV